MRLAGSSESENSHRTDETMYRRSPIRAYLFDRNALIAFSDRPVPRTYDMPSLKNIGLTPAKRSERARAAYVTHLMAPPSTVGRMP